MSFCVEITGDGARSVTTESVPVGRLAVVVVLAAEELLGPVPAGGEVGAAGEVGAMVEVVTNVAVVVTST